MGYAEDYSQAISTKTGLWPSQDPNVPGFVGNFQGFNAWTTTRMVADEMAIYRGVGGGYGGELGSLLGMALGGDTGYAMAGGKSFLKYDFGVQLNANLPGATLREGAGWGLLADKNLQVRPALGQKCQSGVAWIDSRFEVCSNDPQFIWYVCQSQELQQWLGQWHFTNLAWSGSNVALELVDSGSRISHKFGTGAMRNGDLQLWGLSLCAAAARAALAR